MVIGTVKPPLVEMMIANATRRYFINIGISHIGENEYEYEHIDIPIGKFDYEGIVDTLVTFKFPNDKMQAVINNYLLEPENSEYTTAFHEMQAWRKEAKEIAKQALEYELH